MCCFKQLHFFSYVILQAIFFTRTIIATDIGTHVSLRGIIRSEFGVTMAQVASWRDHVCSPISALMPLGMLAYGATGSSQRQLQEAIGFSESLKKTISKIRSVEKISGVTINIANKLFIEKRLKVNRQYQSKTCATFKACFEQVYFSRGSEAANKINSWVSQETGGKIRKLINAGVLSSDTKLVAVNVVYFYGRWEHRFREPVTKKFYTRNGVTNVKMMIQEQMYKYTFSDQLRATIVSIPYVGKEATMLVVLPNEKDGLSIMLHKLKLAPDLLNDAIRNLRSRRVRIELPKFKIATEIDLKDIYRKLGITKIFQSSGSGLSGIVDGQEMYVDAAIQKAIVEVDERGTEAAAGSLASFVPVSSNMMFKADHPFYFMIVAKDQPLFTGTFTGSKS